MSLAFLVLASGALAHGVAAQSPEAQTVVALQDLYGSTIMAGGENADVDAEIAATGAPEAVQAFFRARHRGTEVLQDDFLSLPARETLEMIFSVDSLHQVRGETERPLAVAEAALSAAASHDVRRLVAVYYRMLFVGVGNARPFDLSAYDFTPLAYTGDTELAAIFYFEAVRVSKVQIWGLMNIPKPPNFQGAADLIAVYPRFDGEPYYAYQNVEPGDFMSYAAGEYRRYRDFHQAEVYEMLIYHLSSILNTTGSRSDAAEVVDRSILSRPEYFGSFSDPEMLAGIRENLGSPR